VTEKIAFTRANGKVLRVTSGKEAVELFITSQRIYEDLAMSSKLAVDSSDFDMEVVVRKWMDIYQEWEFRSFIFGGKMTGCSQYYSGTFVPELFANKEGVQNRIVSFFESTKHLIPLDDYVIDYALDPFSEKIWIVEINNPPPVAGQALFDWDKEEDNRILRQGPFQFRILEKPPKDPMKYQNTWLQTMKEQSNKKAKGGQKSGKRLSL
jgi:hypothetical protein